MDGIQSSRVCYELSSYCELIDNRAIASQLWGIVAERKTRSIRSANWRALSPEGRGSEGRPAKDSPKLAEAKAR